MAAKSPNRFVARMVCGIVVAVPLLASSVPAAAESGFSGLHVQGMSMKIADALTMKSAAGVLVRDVALAGPAARAGIKRGDIVVEYAGQKIKDFNTMVKAAGATKPGQKVTVSIIRQGKPLTLTMMLDPWTPPWRITKSAVASLPASGLTLANLTAKLRKAFGLRWGSVGVVVTLVDPDRSDIGLRRGDLITLVNQKEVWEPAQVIASYNEAKNAGRKELLLLVERINGFHYMLLPVR